MELINEIDDISQQKSKSVLAHNEVKVMETAPNLILL